MRGKPGHQSAKLYVENSGDTRQNRTSITYDDLAQDLVVSLFPNIFAADSDMNQVLPVTWVVGFVHINRDEIAVIVNHLEQNQLWPDASTSSTMNSSLPHCLGKHSTRNVLVATNFCLHLCGTTPGASWPSKFARIISKPSVAASANVILRLESTYRGRAWIRPTTSGVRRVRSS